MLHAAQADNLIFTSFEIFIAAFANKNLRLAWAVDVRAPDMGGFIWLRLFFLHTKNEGLYAFFPNLL